MAFMSARVLIKERKKLEKLGIEMTELQEKALIERIVMLTAKQDAEREMANLFQRLRHPE